jgi:hypothetical protein
VAAAAAAAGAKEAAAAAAVKKSDGHIMFLRKICVYVFYLNIQLYVYSKFDSALFEKAGMNVPYVLKICMFLSLIPTPVLCFSRRKQSGSMT